MKRILIIFIAIVVFYNCTSSGDNEPDITDNFDRKVMLAHISDNIIIPSYESFSDKMDALNTSGITFTNNPSEITLNEVRVAWLEAYTIWQHIEMFNIDRAEEIGYSFFMNIYPLTVSDVDKNIAAGSYNLDSPNNHDAQGFPALDYLFYGIGNNDAEILSKYTEATNKDNYKKYVVDVLAQMTTLTNDVFTDFKNNRNTFVNSSANTVTSAVNKLVNDYIFYLEKGLRANKIGIPSGFFSTTPLPEKVEAYYRKDISKTLALEALTTVQNVFTGNYSGNTTANRSSFKAYLEALNRQDLATAIENQFVIAKIQMNTLNNDFSAQIIADNTEMLKTRDELQKAVILLKVDMLQAFNVSVDYVDADGD